MFFCLSLRACCFGFTLKCLPCICAIIKQNEINVLFKWKFLVCVFFSYWNFKIRFFKKPIFYNYVLIYMYKLKLITYTNYTSTCTHIVAALIGVFVYINTGTLDFQINMRNWYSCKNVHEKHILWILKCRFNFLDRWKTKWIGHIRFYILTIVSKTVGLRNWVLV